MIATRRDGAALILALLAIIVLDCVVLGTLHIALQEHRIGGNRRAVLQLRLDAEGGIRRALGSWSGAIDTMFAGSASRTSVPVASPPVASVTVERLADQLFLLESTASEPLPRVGRATTRMLVHPPAVSPLVDPAPAPISAAGSVVIRTTGVVNVNPPATCSEPPPAHSILAPAFGVAVLPGGSINAPAGVPAPHPLTGSFARLAALAPGSVQASADTTIATSATGVIIVAGNATLAAGATHSGVLVASGSVTIESGANVRGAVHAGGNTDIAGQVQWDPCAVATAIAAARLDHATPAGPRAWLPAF